MAISLPAAPQSFYLPSLNTLKDSLEATHGSTKGQVALITVSPDNIDSCWSQVGAAGNTVATANRGIYVVANKDIGIISEPIAGPEETGGELGYKLHFSPVIDIPVYIDGTGASTAVIVGIALLVGVDNFAAGTDAHVKYIFKVNDLTINDGALVKLPDTEVTIYFSEEDDQPIAQTGLTLEVA